MKLSGSWVILILIAAFTLLSLVTRSRGQVTDVWIRSLEALVGVGWCLGDATCCWGIGILDGHLCH